MGGAAVVVNLSELRRALDAELERVISQRRESVPKADTGEFKRLTDALRRSIAADTAADEQRMGALRRSIAAKKAADEQPKARKRVKLKRA